MSINKNDIFQFHLHFGESCSLQWAASGEEAPAIREKAALTWEETSQILFSNQLQVGDWAR